MAGLASWPHRWGRMAGKRVGQLLCGFISLWPFLDFLPHPSWPGHLLEPILSKSKVRRHELGAGKRLWKAHLFSAGSFKSSPVLSGLLVVQAASGPCSKGNIWLAYCAQDFLLPSDLLPGDHYQPGLQPLTSPPRIWGSENPPTFPLILPPSSIQSNQCLLDTCSVKTLDGGEGRGT